MQFQVYNKLKNLKQCVFSIQGKYYYIGCGVCRECTQEEIKNYHELLKEYGHMQASKHIQPVSYDQLKKLFESVMWVDTLFDPDLYENKDLKKLLESLSKEELNSLLIQEEKIHSMWIEIRNYFEGRETN